MRDADKIEIVVFDVYNELVRARAKHPKPMHSHHEAFSVILEEFEEYKAEVRRWI